LVDGLHSITATVVDSKGRKTTTPTPKIVNVTGTNMRPLISVSAPQNGYLHLPLGGDLDVTCSASVDDAQDLIQRVVVTDINIFTDAGTISNIVHEHFPNSTGDETFTVDTAGWTPGTHRLAVRSKSTATGLESYPEYFEVFIEDSSHLNFANTLAQNLVDSNSVTISNPVFRGMVGSAGEFTGGLSSGLQMEAGVGFSTGDFSVWNRGNVEEFSGEAWHSPGDPTLEDRTAGITTSDASSLEFTLSPAHRQLSIELQLASEEYLRFVSGANQDVCFNDAATVSIDGVIVSLLPACDNVIALNTIHPAISDSLCIPFPSTAPPINSQFYVSKETIDEAFSFPQLPPRIEYTATTLKFRNTIFVEPGRTHQMKIVVADTDDGIAFRRGQLDTAIFIKNGSIKSPPLSQ